MIYKLQKKIQKIEQLKSRNAILFKKYIDKHKYIFVINTLLYIFV